jgi:hypothetical protein
MSNYGSLAQNARAQQLKSAKSILWVVGILTICVQGFLFANAKSEVDEEINKELAKNGGGSIALIEKQAPEVRAEFDKAYVEAVGKVRLIYGAFLAVGVMFIGCALLVDRKPVIATVTGLVLYLGAKAAVGMLAPEALAQGLIISVAIVIGLIGAVKAALAVERQERLEREQGVV